MKAAKGEKAHAESLSQLVEELELRTQEMSRGEEKILYNFTGGVDGQNPAAAC